MANLSNVNNKFLVTTGGNVGIGVTGPLYRLEASSSDFNFVGKFQATGTGYAPASILLETTGSASRGQGMYHYNTTADENWFTGVPYDVNSEKWIVANQSSTSQLVDTAQLSHALMTVAADGNVGIGETNPSSKLEVRSETATHKLVSLNRAASVTAAMYLGNDSSNNAIISSNYSDLIFGRDQSSTLSEWMRIKRDGNVGIGTASPAHLLQVKSSYDNFITKIENDLGSEGGNGLWVDTRWNVANNVPFKVTSNSGNSPMMIIKGSGAVGIGVTDPAAKLEVKENLYVSHPNAEEITFRLDNYGATGADAGPLLRMFNQLGTTVVNIDSRSGSSRDTYFNQGGNFGIGTTTPIGKLTVQGDDAHIFLRSNDYTIARIINRGSTHPNLDIGIFSLYNANAENVRLDGGGTSWLNGGNVGIGTTSPNAKLEVDIAVGEVGLGVFTTGESTTPNVRFGRDYTQYVGFQIQDRTNTIVFRQDEGTGEHFADLDLWTSTTGNKYFRINNNDQSGNLISNWLTIKNSNVGIGTTNPSSKLTVYGGGTTSSTLELRGAANGGDNATISTQQSMVFQIGSAGATGRSFTFSKNGLGYSDGTALFAIDANGGTFNRFWPQTGTSGSSSVVQTTLIPEPGIYEYFLQGNPNAGGSGAYRSLQAGLITIAVDYTQAKSVFLRIQKTVTAQDGGGSSNIQLNLNVYMLYNGSASGEQSIGNKNQSVIYLTVSGYMGTVGSGQILRLTRKV